MEKQGGIYQIRNITNNHLYIGSTKNFEVRWKRHKSALKNNKNQPNKYIQYAWTLYGEKSFVFEIIEVIKDITKKSLKKKEQYHANLLNPKYNIREIVESNLGFRQTEETKKKISKANKGKTWEEIHGIEKSVEMKKNLASRNHFNSPMLGKHHSEKTKEKQSLKKIGKPSKKRKLSDQQVLEIRELYKNGETYISLGKKYDISFVGIKRIIKREYYKDII